MTHTARKHRGGHWAGRSLLLALALLLSGCRLSAPPQATERGFGLVIPIYNEAGLAHAVTTLEPHLRADDRFMIVSGNSSGLLDAAFVNRAALALRETYPRAPIYAATSGLGNVERAAQQVGEVVTAIVYVYEPNFPNQPEFDWDFSTTLARFQDAGARSGERKLVGKPTGRPLLQPSLQAYAWDYGEIAATVDELFIQTQTYCKESSAAFGNAIDEIIAQYGVRAKVSPWVPQVTVDPDAPNGTSVAQARACIAEAQRRGVSGALLWWSPPFAERAASFIAALNVAEASPQHAPLAR